MGSIMFMSTDSEEVYSMCDYLVRALEQPPPPRGKNRRDTTNNQPPEVTASFTSLKYLHFTPQKYFP